MAEAIKIPFLCKMYKNVKSSHFVERLGLSAANSATFPVENPTRYFKGETVFWPFLQIQRNLFRMLTKPFLSEFLCSLRWAPLSCD